MTKKVMQPQSIVRSERYNAIIVYANWRHTEKVSPAFKRLVTLLLWEKTKDGETTIERNRATAG
jgi:hypothetical protein